MIQCAKVVRLTTIYCAPWRVNLLGKGTIWKVVGRFDAVFRVHCSPLDIVTVTNEAAANKILAESVSSDPNVLVRECLRLIDESKPLPAGFQCWPNSGGSIVIPAA